VTQLNKERLFVRRPYVPHLAVVTIVLSLCLTSVLDVVDLKLMDARFNLLRKEASDQLVVVTIDPQSLKEVDYWPWPRGLHALMIEHLEDAGAETILFDIDFSSPSGEADDAALERTISQAQTPIVLPSFLQRKDAANDTAHIYTSPLRRFARHAAPAIANVVPSADGIVRQTLSEAQVGDRRLPGISVIAAGSVEPPRRNFFIDYGIDLHDIPVISAVDVLADRFDPKAVEGRRVLIGASALELGDVLTVPVHSSLPGVMIQALASETLIQGRGLVPLPNFVVFGVVLLIPSMLWIGLQRLSWRRGLLLVLAIPTALFILSCAIQAYTPLSPQIAAWSLAVALTYVTYIVGQIDLQAEKIFAQSLALIRKENMMQRVFRNSFDGIIVLDCGGHVLSVNAAAERIFHCDEPELLGRLFEHLALTHSSLSWASEAKLAFLDSLAEQAQPKEFVSSGHTERDMFLELAVTVSGQGSSKIYILLVRDISARRTAQAETREAQERLQAAVVAAVEAKEQAEAADLAKSEFIANMSHELRTPLNAILGFSEMISKQALGPDSHDRYIHYAKDIHASGAHLLSLINDVLDIARIETGKIDLREEPLALDDVIAACFRMVRPRAEEKNVALEQQMQVTGVVMRGDERVIKQSLLNVLSNAVKFTPEGGRVTTHVDRDRDGGLLVKVSDTGIGIAEEHLTAVLEPFRQVDSSFTRRYEGTGLGLPLTKGFMELHGGSLFIESEPGKGTQVILNFPRNRLLALKSESEMPLAS